MLTGAENKTNTNGSMAIGALISKHVNIAPPARSDKNEGYVVMTDGERAENQILAPIHLGDENQSKNETVQASFIRVNKMLQAKIGTEVFQSWFGRMELEQSSAHEIQVSVPTTFLRTWIKSHYADELLALWQQEDARILKVEIVVRNAARTQRAQPSLTPLMNTSAATHVPAAKTSPFPSLSAPKAQNTASMHDQHKGGNVIGSPVDSRYTFENFIEGPSNNVCLAAAKTAVDKGANSVRFNPLFFYSSVGLGKTHLLQSIANAAKAKDPSQRVVYLTAEYFMWRFASAIRDSKALVFKEALNDIDLLIIDDMQFLQGEKIQSEFCHLINTLLDSAKQVVVAADRPPAELESLDPRVRSRLKGGVALEIEAPDYPMRLSMLQKRLELARKDDATLTISDEILEHVAKTVSSSFRELEGAFNQLMFRQSFESAISLDRVDDILGHLTRAEERKKVRIEDIQRVVAQHFSVPRNEMLSNRRTRTVVRPRQIAMYLSKIMTPRSLPEIGRRFGGRDHTTVLHAVRKVEAMKTSDSGLSKELELLRRLIEE
ncbi:MAG: chromosomal replication initiator protein DnaA [Ahrensia sp.]|nr:chromosomal replication initiator protein DnaA [Ahrensia sp.]